MWFTALLNVSYALPGSDATWSTLQTGDTTVECTTVAGEPWCRSSGLVELPIEAVSKTLENMAAHQDLFESIVSIHVLAPDVMHITLDFPFPLSDRDYVAKYARSTEGEAKLYRWSPVTDAAAPPVSGVVRLPEMAGEWKLEPAGSGKTKVTYTWHADVLGSLPNASLTIARKKAGSEALKDIRKASAAAQSR